MKTKVNFHSSVLNTSFAIALFSANILAQARPANPKPAETSIFESMGFWIGALGAACLIGILLYLRKGKNQLEETGESASVNDGIRMTYNEKSPEAEPVKPESKRDKPAPVKAKNSVHNFTRLHRTNSYIQLPESKDAALLRAIEEVNEESEEDVQARTNALKLLSSYRNSNAVAAIAQMALYDLSSKLRSDAVGILSELDHESVFETIVTACADPTREVRAAAARALFKLSFDRGHSWTRIIESGDISRMRHAARCAIEGDIVVRSFDRLIHPDRTVAYETFALVALLIKAGETGPIYSAVAAHKDEKVKLAILNVLQVIIEEETFDGLSRLIETSALTPDVAAKANEIRSMLQLSHA